MRSLRVAPRGRIQRGREVTRYHPTLELSTADGKVREEAIAGFIRQEQAEALVRWLRSHLKLAEAAPGERRSA